MRITIDERDRLIVADILRNGAAALDIEVTHIAGSRRAKMKVPAIKAMSEAADRIHTLARLLRGPIRVVEADMPPAA